MVFLEFKKNNFLPGLGYHNRVYGDFSIIIRVIIALVLISQTMENDNLKW
jgi:hypothetical protein